MEYLYKDVKNFVLEAAEIISRTSKSISEWTARFV